MLNSFKLWAGVVWQQFRAWAGRIWGKTTTLLLAVSAFMGSMLAMPEIHDLLAGFPWFPYMTAIVGIAGFFGRLWAPPPPSVSITPGTNATIVDDHTVTIQTATPLPAATVQAAVEAPNVTTP